MTLITAGSRGPGLDGYLQRMLDQGLPDPVRRVPRKNGG